jgi:hypothetical protein
MAVQRGASFTVTATNSAGTATSAAATLTVRLTLFQQGYATVGIISYPSPTVASTYVATLLGER